ncbi:MAG: hypothetical protein JWQ72_1079 [Polaromonas sp.]|nr:hypothetical protein [Polaromonas sp.]
MVMPSHPGCACELADGVTTFTAGRLSRRSILAGAGGALFSGLVASQAAPPAPAQGVIDIHHHVSPPTFIRELIAQGAGERPVVDWTLSRSLEDMDKAGVTTSITSITTPGIWFGDNARAARLARECNEYGARLVTERPGRFGLFASLPLPDVDASLKEIEFAFDTLKADGVGILTSFGDKWLGDSLFTPVLAELNRRKAVVYTHPTVADCCRNLLPDVHYSVIELATDTTRAIASLVFSGAARRFPDITFIFSHAGGTLPFLAERFANYPRLDRGLGLGKNIAEKVGGDVRPVLQTFYYDTAQASLPSAMSSLLQLVGPSRILFGTDFPFRTASDHLKNLALSRLGEGDMLDITRKNALRLLPRLNS